MLTHQDRLLRFGAELIFALCELQGIEIVIIHRGEQPSFEEELAQDVLESSRYLVLGCMVLGVAKTSRYWMFSRSDAEKSNGICEAVGSQDR